VSLRKALNHLARYLPEPAKWPGQQINGIDAEDVVCVLRRAQVAYGAAVYQSVLSQLDSSMVREDRSALLYPLP
jgi:hypothetical protein